MDSKEPTDAQSLSRGNILIVDDGPANLRLLSRMLIEQGYKVRAAPSGARALAAVRSASPDLILLDIIMPEMDGYEVCECLKADAQSREIPIIFISALGQTEDKVRAFAAGGVDYVTKPFKVEEVVARVETHLGLRKLQKNLQDKNAQLQREIAERMRAEETLRQQTLELEARNAELDAFAHTVAHDLKGPLTLVVGFSGLLEEHFAGMPQKALRDSLQEIERSGRKMATIVDELLLLASVRGVQEVRIQTLDMARLVTEAQKRLVYMIEKHQAEIIFPPAETWPLAQGHGPWIEEVWTNYLSNAIKYGGRPPRIELGAGLSSGGGEVKRGQVRFWVRDNGPGLTLEEQARLFTPFERLHQVRAKGHGLGLSIVKRIVERLGGQVGVESSVGEGSTFFFTLPSD